MTVSRRRKKRPQSHHVPIVTAAPEVFSELELDFFRRGDELHLQSADAGETPESDA
jgi:hypothetical protein